MRQIPTRDPNVPIPLHVDESGLAEMQAEYGDIVQVRAEDGTPARDWRIGIPFPVDQKWVLTPPVSKP